ncbi:hypothetical protein PP1Y_AT31023 [Novosphingobium sp. PP1Y]|nr:hypothetical protein PP1Y_AT31023 [Novosphingobium sp. PP1Y]
MESTPMRQLSVITAAIKLGVTTATARKAYLAFDLDE